MNAIGTQLRDPLHSGLPQCRTAVKINKWTPSWNSGGIPQISARFSLSMEISRLTLDGAAGAAATKFSDANGYREIFILPVELTTSRIGTCTVATPILCQI